MKILKIVAGFALLILFFLIATSSADSYFYSGDEALISNVTLIDQYGISTEFLRHFWGMAGPLHPILHWIFRPLTGAVPPGIRLLGFAILCFFIWFFRKDEGHRILFIPMTFICAGYAMTEFPAMLFLLCSILIINDLEKNKAFQLVKIGLAAACLTIAISGRWNYLALLPFFWIWLSLKYFFEANFSINVTKIKQNWIYLIVFMLISSVCPIWILHAWGGIMPPEASLYEGYKTFDIAPHNFILSACFTTLIVLMLRPNWLFEIKNYFSVFTYLSISVFVTNVIFQYYSFVPAQSVFNRFSDILPLWMVGNAFGSLSICLGLVFFYSLFLHVWKRRNDWNYVFYAVCTLLILLSAIKITNLFSSRYPYQALPFLLLMLQYEEKTEEKWWEIALAIAGISWGVLTWLSYQHIYA